MDGVYTGRRVIQTNKNKSELLRAIVKEHNLSMVGSIGVGDTHRDISLLSAVDHPIAFNPNAALYEVAEEHKWPVVIERKNMIYELAPGPDDYTVQSAHPTHQDEHQEGQR